MSFVLCLTFVCILTSPAYDVENQSHKTGDNTRRLF